MAKNSRFGSMESINKNFKSFLSCRWLLYVAFFLAASDLYIFAVNGELFFVALFVIIGFLTTFFSKNMSVILFTAMILTNILRFGKDVRVYEGMEDASESVIPLGTTANGANTTRPTTNDETEGDDYQFLDHKDTEKKNQDLLMNAFKESLIESIVSEDKPKKKSKLADDVAPVKGSAPIKPAEDDFSSKLAGLDQETISLLQKQQKLLENMENLKPLLSNAERLLENFNLQPNMHQPNMHQSNMHQLKNKMN